MKELLNRGFYKRNLHDLIDVSNSLLFSSGENKLMIFIIKSLFKDLLEFCENTPVIMEKASIVENGLLKQIDDLLSCSDKNIYPQLEELINNYISNKTKLGF